MYQQNFQNNPMMQPQQQQTGLQTTQALQPAHQFIVQVTQQEIQNQAMKNSMRQFFAQTCANDQNFFMAICQAVADLADMQVAQNFSLQGNLQGVIASAAEAICAMQTSVLANNNKQMFTDVTPQQANDVVNKVNSWNQLAMQLRNFANQRAGMMGMSMGMSGNFGNANTMAGFGQPAQRQFAQTVGGPPITHSFGTAGMQPTGNQSFGAFGMPQQMNVGIPAPSQTMSGGIYTDGITFGQQQPQQPQQPQYQHPQAQRLDSIDCNPGNRAPVVRHSNTTTVSSMQNNGFPEFSTPARNTLAQSVAAVTAPQQPQINYERPYDLVTDEYGNRTVPAILNPDMRRTFALDRMHPLIYDPSSHLKMFSTDTNGNVYEILTVKKNAMSYLDHEMDPKLRRIAEEARIRDSGKIWANVVNMTQMPVFPAAVVSPAQVTDKEQADALLDKDSVAIYEAVLTVSSPQHVREELQSTLGRTAYMAMSSNAHEIYSEEVERVVVDLGARAHLRALVNAGSFDIFCRLLTDAESFLGRDLVRVINRRMTEEMNFVLSVRLGLRGWSIDSFVDDLADLRSTVISTYNADLWDVIGGAAPEVIATALNFRDEEGTLHYRTVALGQDVGPEGFDDDMIVFGRTAATLFLPHANNDLGFTFQDGGLVREREYPNLYAALMAMMVRLADGNGHRYYLETEDGVRYHVASGLMGDGSTPVVYPA